MSTNNSWNNRISAANSAITLNSLTNPVNISSDASATTVNIATGGAVKTVSVGSTNTTSSLILNSGSGGIIASGVSGISVANKNYMSINTATGALGSDVGAQAQMILISTQTASASTTLDFTSGITSTYGVYFVKVAGILLSAAGQNLEMVLSDNGGSSYLSSTYTAGYNSTAWNSATWVTNVNSTALSTLARSTNGTTAAGSLNGYFYIFNLATANTSSWNGRFYSGNQHYVIYGACTTPSINAMRFRVTGGANMTSGSISLYGILNS